MKMIYKNIYNNQKKQEMIQSSTFLLLVIIFSIVVSDMLVWIVLRFLPPLTFLGYMMIGSFLLLIILFPILYFFAFHPFTVIIAERQKEEEKARMNEEKFRKTLITSADSINITRLSDGMFNSINEEFTKVFGYSEKEVVGKTSVELNFWANPEIRKIVVKELEEKGRIDSFEVSFLRKDGSIVNGLMSASLIDLDGVPHILNVTKDITGRKRIEEELALEQFLVNALMDNLPDHIYFKDLKSRFIRINKAHAKFLGLDDPDQAVGKTDFDFFTSEHAQQAFEDEKTIISTGRVMDAEEKETYLNKADTWVSTIKLPLSDKDGSIIGTFGISRDVTERKRRELENRILHEITQGVTTSDNLDELLKLIHHSLEKVVYAENCFIALHDQKSGFFSFPYFVDKFDTAPLPVYLGKSCTAYVLRTAKPLLLTQQIFDDLVVQNEVELVGSNSPSWIGIPLPTPSKVIGVLVLQHYEKENAYSEADVKFLTSIGSQIAFAIDRKQAEAALRESERDLNESQKITGLGSYKLDVNSGTWTSSQILDSIFGIDDGYDKSVNGWIDLVHPSWRETMSEYLTNDVIKNHTRFNKEYIIIRKNDGTERWVHGQGELLFDSDKKVSYMVGSIMDITQRKLSEEEIKLKNVQLQKTNAEKDIFFSILAHDLRGPLSSFVGATQIISEEIQTMDIEEIKEITLSMKMSAANIYSLLENLLEWSRLKRDGLDFIPVKINVKEKIEACINVLSESARKKRIEITISIPDEVEVFADNHMFDTVIRNLVSNAIKFTHIGGKVSVSAEYKSDHSILVQISDSGIGMTMEMKIKVFLLDGRTSRQGTEGEPSTGLGLLLCKEFIDKHGGKIWVDSEAGKGSVFSFTIPGRSKK
jgi:PAS domain S-box-containing protein